MSEDTPYVLTPEEQQKVDAATAKFRAAWAARPADADSKPPNERLNGPVFVDADGNVQHEPTPEVAARHAEFLRKADEYARRRAERGSGSDPSEA